MRIQNTIKNGMWAIGAYLLLFILGLVTRKLFLENFDAEILGYSGLLSNVFSLLSIAEMGVGTVISYGLYRELEAKNKREISKLMMIYKVMYRFIGLGVLILGIIAYFFLPFIIVEETANWTYVRVIYVMELCNVLGTYFMSFRRLLYIADQKGYICVKVDLITNIIVLILKVILSVWIQNYVLYLGVAVIGTMISNLILSYLCNRQYPYARKATITRSDFKRLHFFKDIKSYSIQRIANAIYGGVDNIIATRMLGIYSVVLLSNYVTIERQVTNLMDKLMNGLQSSIGNLVYDQKSVKKESIFKSLDLAGYMLAVFMCISYLVLFQPMIILWLGDEYTLSYSFVFFYAINQYIAWNHRIIIYFRSAIGYFEEDIRFMLAGAFINLLTSIFFVQTYGLTGLIMGTLIGHIVLWIGRTKVVYHRFIQDETIKSYWFRQGFRLFLLLLEVLLTCFLAAFLDNTVLGMLGKMLLCVTVPNLCNLLLFWRQDEFVYIKGVLSNLLRNTKNKMLQKWKRW